MYLWRNSQFDRKNGAGTAVAGTPGPIGDYKSYRDSHGLRLVACADAPVPDAKFLLPAVLEA